MLQHMRQPYSKVLALLGLWLLALNFTFPLISDDYCHLNQYQQMGGWAAAQNSFMHWNARIGELLSVFWGEHLTGWVFALVNSAVLMVILCCLHPLVFARQGSTRADAIWLLSCFTLLTIASVFAAVFLWRAGAMNYAWALALCMLHCCVYRYFYCGLSSRYDRLNMPWLIVFTGVSFVAGMSSFDLGVLISLLHLSLISYLYYQGKPVSWRYAVPAVAFMAGFATLYFAPGTAARAQGVADYVALSQLFDWLVTLQWPQLTTHVLDSLGRAMYKTNYLLALASLLSTLYLWRLNRSKVFLPGSLNALRFAYLGLVLMMLALLFSHSSKPPGDALGAVLLLSNAAFALFACFMLIKHRQLDSHLRRFAIMVAALQVMMIVDASLYAVGVVPARRAYLTASLLAAVILALLAQRSWCQGTQLKVFVPLLIISVSLISLQTWGLKRTQQELLQLPIALLSAQDSLVIQQDYKIVKAPQFYDWSSLSSNQNDWLNRCVARYYGVAAVSQSEKTQKVSVWEYIRYVISLTNKSS